ncbi:Gfo/Idh/MocA family oxidoreductase [uncultured Ferrimonas sp.]|uniref:Gfo/Idh/MocA family protein n=1 Tax=uncultured Ferrimonas sp. TaxID=432640 RepID=UPI0026363B61|nr:Gfo/Idh/MocA family oxidoreductase [uncultured Ferrimonas sp.]
MSKPLRWGIIGTSFISGVMIDAIRLEGRSEVALVAGRNPQTCADFAAQYQLAYGTDYDALITDPAIDIIYIALPNHLHAEYVVKAAQAGKAIVCEKSLSVDMASTERALAAVAKAGVFFAEGLMYLNHPLIRELLRLLQTGAIGELNSVHASYSAAISQFTNPGSKGTLFNLGCYPLSLLQLVLQQQGLSDCSKGAQFSGFGRVGSDGNIVEANVAARFSNGVTAQLHSAEDYGLTHQFELLGSKGYLRCHSNPWLPGESNQLLLAEYEQPEQIIEVTADGDGFLYQVRHVIDALRRGEKQLARPSATVDDSRQVMALLMQWHQAVS